MKRRVAIVMGLILASASTCLAHWGSPDVYLQGHAGPYHLVVWVRTPPMIPGVAEIQVRSDTPGIRAVQATPLYLVGAGSKYPPPPDTLPPVPGAPQSFAGKLWLMDAGSWQVQILASGSLGTGELAVPVPAFARSTLPMQKGLGAFLLSLMILLVAALVAIFGAARRESTLPPGQEPGPAQKRAAWRVMAGTLALTMGGLAIGNWWWNRVAMANQTRKVYQPPQLVVSVAGDTMNLHIAESRWHIRRPDTVMTEIIPDHGHLMHLFLVREPGMDRMYHLHPQQDRVDPATFAESFAGVEPGRYRLFADIVRASGFPDTMVADVDIPKTQGNAMTGDDSVARTEPLTWPRAGNLMVPLSAGARMVWERDSGPLPSQQMCWFQFRVEDATGRPVSDLEPYMGMALHAELFASDFSVFAHVHPDGSVPMAALDLADRTSGARATATAPAEAMAGMDMSASSGASETLPAELSFPYGFPKPGLYRIFVQVKRKGRVETGVFDAKVN
ncbi:MAG TPA: hypothetical protein VEJ45_08860 [Candidatus Acidoferrales bacterium]|nr:hypothetical protein [Candidatus Acidoferrales bacterium]